MKLLITGVAGFVGSGLAEWLLSFREGLSLVGLDNLTRRGSETNLAALERLGVRFVHGDIRRTEDLAELPRVDWIVDCSGNPSVLAGLEQGTARLVADNLIGTLNLLEKARRDGSGFVFLSTSRVYSIEGLRGLPLRPEGSRFVPDASASFPRGFGARGVNEGFSTGAPVSLYGACKLASEVMVLEYGSSFGLPVWVDRCGVIAGAGQFGKQDQGVFAFWIYQWLMNRPLAYIGFGGEGRQVRDLVSVRDLARLLDLQLASPDRPGARLFNVGGGAERSLSLRELSEYCEQRLAVQRAVASVPETRPFDVPYYVTDAGAARQAWNWEPQQSHAQVLDEIVAWAEQHRPLLEGGF